jgi:hypothetical protein
MKRITKEKVKQVAKAAAKRGVKALDAALVKAGAAARERQQMREHKATVDARKAKLKKVGKAAMVAGAAAATVMAARVVARNVRRGATLPD